MLLVADSTQLEVGRFVRMVLGVRRTSKRYRTLNVVVTSAELHARISHGAGIASVGRVVSARTNLRTKVDDGHLTRIRPPAVNLILAGWINRP